MDYKILNFVIFCVGSVADALKMSAKDVYQRMSKGGIISDYIVPCYDVLHTFSREYIVEDLVDLMNKKGVLKTAWIRFFAICHLVLCYVYTAYSSDLQENNPTHKV